ncbi:hypothetical protein IMG5_199540 [Ichthyophthirius multifiliis]|uniref:P-loop containing nucleoside triphosphate hydrolase n=1 Tax=Ichthyophthirius multifiliis TaxID=5932 RepID=G0R5L4_ICHMU|nr:hypothetical protein IMG5_199540 [Ichthyophthirius multifiliis]EGR27274.1 hypothetical protein IMG5_199540 [Ichthyophthirius multifiliis]|eukprot:XP_004024158.1 hypothetical protein IMG5_199540 [Ichthyophthirius multifiliis]
MNPYDLINIEVTLNDNYYILSRYLISRMLTLICIDKQKASSIAKTIKKKLVELNISEITQQKLEEILFETIIQQIKQNPLNVIQTYKIVSEFYRTRTPLIILILGAPKIGKSSLANQLADKLNISNVLQTDIISSVMDSMSKNIIEQNNWNDIQISDDEMLKLYQQKCYQIRKGANTDILKCLTQGKPLIVEGTELIPQLFIKKRYHVNGFKYDIQDEKIQNIKQNLQKFIDGKIDNNDLNIEYQIGSQQDLFEIYQPDPEEQESQKEKDRIIQAQKYYQNIDQSNQGVVLAFHLIINKKQHKFNIKNSSLIQSIQNQQQRKIMCEKYLQKYQAIQNYLIQEFNLTRTIPIEINCQQYTLDILQKILLNKIVEQYHYQQQKK